MVRRLTMRLSTRRQKSNRSVKGPALRAARIASYPNDGSLAKAADTFLVESLRHALPDRPRPVVVEEFGISEGMAIWEKEEEES